MDSQSYHVIIFKASSHQYKVRRYTKKQKKILSLLMKRRLLSEIIRDLGNEIHSKKERKKSCESGGMAQWLKMCTALLEAPSSVSSTHKGCLTMAWRTVILDPGNQTLFSCHHGQLHSHEHTPKQTLCCPRAHSYTSLEIK